MRSPSNNVILLKASQIIEQFCQNSKRSLPRLFYNLQLSHATFLRKIGKKVVPFGCFITYSYLMETFLRKIGKKVVPFGCFITNSYLMETFLWKISKKVATFGCFITYSYLMRPFCGKSAKRSPGTFVLLLWFNFRRFFC